MRIGVALLVVVVGINAAPLAAAAEARSSLAERYFRGIYGCGPEVVEELASSEIVVSYPIFEDVLGKPALRGRAAVEAFAERFCQKWKDVEFAFHRSVVDENRVVLVWSFSAQDADAAPGEARSAWGGISLFEFDSEGKIATEIGEESTPGPMGRLAKAGVE